MASVRTSQKWRRREWTFPVTEGPLAGPDGVDEITVRSLSMRMVDKAQAASFKAAQDAYGDSYGAWMDRIQARQKDRGESDGEDAPPTDPALRCRAKGFYPPALVLYGVVAIGGDRLPEDEAERQAAVDDMPADIVGWLALQVAAGRDAAGGGNGLIDDDRPTGSGGS